MSNNEDIIERLEKLEHTVRELTSPTRQSLTEREERMLTKDLARIEMRLWNLEDPKVIK